MGGGEEKRGWNGFLLGKAKKEGFLCRFCGKRDGDGHLFWECTFLAPSSMLGNCLSSLHLYPWIVAGGPDVCYGMGGCLDLVVLVIGTLGLLLLGNWLVVSWSADWVLIRWMVLIFRPRPTIGTPRILLWR